MFGSSRLRKYVSVDIQQTTLILMCKKWKHEQHEDKQACDTIANDI